MKHKFLSLFIATVAMTILNSPTFASVTIDGIAYELNGTTATVVGGGNYTGTIVIPASVTYSGTTYSVTSIGDGAFFECTGLTSVTIGNSVTSIGSSAFYGCSGLTSVTIPNSVTSIGDGAFMYCSGLTSVTIPNSVTSIGDSAFKYCSSLTSVTIGNSVTSIGYGAFAYCSGLTSVTIPNSVTSIGYEAFRDCSSLTSVTIPNSVTSIENRAFYECRSLTSIEIPNSVTSIGSEAFSDCSSLTSVTIPNSVTSIGRWAFDGCSSLTSIYVPCGELERFKQMLNDSRVKYEPLPYTITINATNGNVTYPQTMCDDMSLNATPDYGYHFVKWSDGVTDNPRAIELTQDITLTAEFAKNTYTISTTSANPEWGTTAGGKSALYLDEVEISATPNYGYHFVQWSDREYICDDWWDGVCYYGHWGDYNTEPTRTIVVERDSVITATFAKNVYSISKNAEHGTISGNSSAEYLDYVTLTAVPDYGYHFTQWSDGLKDNPRIFRLTQDTTFTAEFAKNTYTISTESSNPEWGTTAGGKSALYLDEVEISATPNYGYHFVQWSDREYICDDWWDGVCYYGHWGDYNTEPTRTIVVERDSVITATFAKNVYTITKNAEHGYISGNWEAEYLDEVTMTVVPDYGYHFTQWSDGNTDNPREIVLTQDTAFTAEFAVDRSGTCGNDYALTWSYNPTDKCLTIQGNGTFDQHIQYGVEAPGNMEKLIVSEGVTTIGASAFAYQATLLEVSLPTTLQTIGEQAFYNCTGLTHIYNFRERPCVAYSNSFDGIDKFSCTLHVLSASVDMYKAATAWRDFYYIQTIDATETTVATDKVSVEPTATTADVVWPAVENAATYELVIKDKSGNVVCTLIFNANGQLTQIAFGAPARDNTAQAAGFAFTVTGLEEGTSYDLTITAKDGNGTTLDEKTIAFTTSSETGVDTLQAGELHSSKVLRNGEVLIMRGGKTYTIQGVEVK